MHNFEPNKQTASRNKRYLLFRICVLIALAAIILIMPGSADIMMPGRFAETFSPLHIFWGIWVAYLIVKLLPFRCLHNRSEYRQFAASFTPRTPYPSEDIIRAQVKKANIQAVKSAAVWTGLTVAIAIARRAGLLHERWLLLLSGIFYVCDLICVVYYCPFQHLLMKNRCCANCRIHNWDAIMMFTPMAFVPSFFGMSLFIMAAVVFLLWEIRFHTHPERFLNITNAGIMCANCPDHTCKIR